MRQSPIVSQGPKPARPCRPRVAESRRYRRVRVWALRLIDKRRQIRDGPRQRPTFVGETREHRDRGKAMPEVSGMLMFLIVLAVIVLAVIARGVRTVPQGYQWTVERFGRYRVTLMPGLRLINPFIEGIGRKVNVQETVLEIPPQNVITKDNASVVGDGIVFYQVIDAARASYEVQDLESAVTNITMTNIRTAIGALDLDETLSKRDEINERLLRVLDAATEPWGTKITRVELKDVRPPEDVQQAMSKQLTADRERRAAVLRAEGIKQAAILEAEGAKQSQVLAAE